MSEFSIFLTSNNPLGFETNTLSSFGTILPYQKFKGEYEVAVSSISFQNNFQFLSKIEDRALTYISADNKKHKIKISNIYYTSLYKLIFQINQALQQWANFNKKEISLKLKYKKNKIYLKGNKNDEKIQFSTKINNLFNSNKKLTFSAGEIITLISNAQEIFSGQSNHILKVLCNLIVPEYINNKLVKQILQLSVAKEKMPGEYIQINLKHLGYRQLEFNHIQNIHIDLVNHNLEPIHLEGGETLISLSFRPQH